MALIDDLKTKITSLDKFIELTKRILVYLPEMISDKTLVANNEKYIIIISRTGNEKKYTRPINTELYIEEIEEFEDKFIKYKNILDDCSNGKTSFNSSEFDIVDQVTYTIQQSIGVALDILGESNSSRKHVGNRFEELVKIIVDEIGIKNKKIVLKIPYSGDKIYSCETDFVFSPHNEVYSNNNTIDPQETVVSLKTTSKDRMGKIFIDKILMSKFINHEVKLIGIFLNDIQRMGSNKISYTFVSGLFMVYTKFLTKLDGVYFIDPPPNAIKEPYSAYIKRFSEFLLTDAKKIILSS
jgi:hypothetical protein